MVEFHASELDLKMAPCGSVQQHLTCAPPDRQLSSEMVFVSCCAQAFTINVVLVPFLYTLDL